MLIQKSGLPSVLFAFKDVLIHYPKKITLSTVETVVKSHTNFLRVFMNQTVISEIY